MKKFDRFDILNVPLSGTALVEAAAGTGKTYAIVGLYLRLVAEQGLDVDQILVVTFTEAATQELKEKIRSALRRAFMAFRHGVSTGDPVVDGLAEKLQEKRDLVARRFYRALVSFDDSAVFTIHGFCSRVLGEHAFESGALFDSRLVTNQDDLKRMVAEDFWRINICNSSPVFTNYILEKGSLSPETLSSLLASRGGHHEIKLVPDPDERVDTKKEEALFLKQFKKVVEQWEEHGKEICTILREHESLMRNKYRRDWVDGWIGAMENYLGSEIPSPELFAKFEKFTAKGIAEGSKNGFTPVEHDFFKVCQKFSKTAANLKALFDRRVALLKSRFLKYAQQELKKRKRFLNVLYFDDLISNLHEITVSGSGSALIGKLRKRYRAALIDEFQDTDPLQYDIFSLIFHGKALFCMIGDPKQAIYAFRGADIFAYLKAVPMADAAYTLNENWRSRPGLVKCVNALFEGVKNPFIYKRIPFRPVSPAADANVPELSLDGKSCSGLCFRVLRKNNFPDTRNKSDWNDVIASDTAARVAKLVAMGNKSRAMIGERPLEKSDIAILVRKHAQANLVHEKLSVLKVHSTILKTGDIFDSHEAFEMELFLWAVAFARDAGLVKAACATDMIGYDAGRIEKTGVSGHDDSGTLERFARYRDTWQKKGFMAMFQEAARKEKFFPKLAAFPDGERRCTNLRHLGELLHQASLEENLGPERLARWLVRHREMQGESEERQLRLESDENAVKIITIHASKGLEYPVVFCPFLGDDVALNRKRRDKGFLFHDKDDKAVLVLENPDDDKDIKEWRDRWEREESAEDVRLLYVALTRAKNICYVSLVPSMAENSRLGFLIKKGGKHENIDKGLDALLQKAGDSLVVEKVLPADLETDPLLTAEEQDSNTLEARRFSRTLPSDWRVTSFSALRQSTVDDLSRHAASDETGSFAVSLPEGMESFPAGAMPGLCLHEIMEHLDFTMAKDSGYLESVVADGLERYGFSHDWLGTVCSMVQRVITTPLPAEGGQKSILLSDIPNSTRINEMEFFFPLRTVTPNILRNAYMETGHDAAISDRLPDRIGKLSFSQTRGFVRGFIDMVFESGGRYFIVDWKSNLLGATLESYRVDNLRKVMEMEYYFLQAHIYAVALNRFLETRLDGYDYRTHFGGIYYLFLRGIDPDAGPEYGIYRETPSAKFIKRLTDCLVDQTGRGV